ncbi:MAG: hypothetical protein VX747_02155, partial [Actinomycetota bacterium]|nr:hypothetical protein [Actinomycetota bacterium]
AKSCTDATIDVGYSCTAALVSVEVYDGIDDVWRSVEDKASTTVFVPATSASLIEYAEAAQEVKAISPTATGIATLCVDFACVAAQCVTIELVESRDVLDGIRFDRVPDKLAMNCNAPAIDFGFECRSTVQDVEVHVAETDKWAPVYSSDALNMSVQVGSHSLVTYNPPAYTHVFVAQSSTTGIAEVCATFDEDVYLGRDCKNITLASADDTVQGIRMAISRGSRLAHNCSSGLLDAGYRCQAAVQDVEVDTGGGVWKSIKDASTLALAVVDDSAGLLAYDAASFTVTAVGPGAGVGKFRAQFVKATVEDVTLVHARDVVASVAFEFDVATLARHCGDATVDLGYSCTATLLNVEVLIEDGNDVLGWHGVRDSSATRVYVAAGSEDLVEFVDGKVRTKDGNAVVGAGIATVCVDFDSSQQRQEGEAPKKACTPFTLVGAADVLDHMDFVIKDAELAKSCNEALLDIGFHCKSEITTISVHNFHEPIGDAWISVKDSTFTAVEVPVSLVGYNNATFEVTADSATNDVA